jgi:hypothetical protein
LSENISTFKYLGTIPTNIETKKEAHDEVGTHSGNYCYNLVRTVIIPPTFQSVGDHDIQNNNSGSCFA